MDLKKISSSSQSTIATLILVSLCGGCSLQVLDAEIVNRIWECNTDVDCPNGKICSRRSLFANDLSDSIRVCVAKEDVNYACGPGSAPEDDEDPTNYHCLIDADGDGVGEPLDCDDGNATSHVRAEDGDCDGILTAADCDDGDATLLARTGDGDCDGVPTAADCDDGDSNLLARSGDGDCDGVLTAEDCNDANPNSYTRADDGDCDGVMTAEDCNDSDASVLARSGDGDCDGVLAAEDCDDADANLGARAEDGDCDGIPTAVDCNDGDANSNTRVEDGDCDGVLAAADCDDQDATRLAIADDGDCDGVTTADDCNDEDPTSLARVNDEDCDGWPTVGEGKLWSRANIERHFGQIRVVKDTDGDGDIDILSIDPPRIFERNGSDYVVRNLPVSGYSHFQVVFDANMDGRMDMLMSRSWQSGNVDRVDSNLCINFAEGFSCSPIATPVWPKFLDVDFDGDGDKDLIVWSRRGVPVSLMTNDGDGNFNVTNLTSAQNIIEGLCVADIDADGDSDLAAVVYRESSTSRIRLWENRGPAGYAASDFVVDGYANVNCMDVDSDGVDEVLIKLWAYNGDEIDRFFSIVDFSEVTSLGERPNNCSFIRVNTGFPACVSIDSELSSPGSLWPYESVFRIYYFSDDLSLVLAYESASYGVQSQYNANFGDVDGDGDLDLVTYYDFSPDSPHSLSVFVNGDNCPTTANPDQTSLNNPGFGDACEQP